MVPCKRPTWYSRPPSLLPSHRTIKRAQKKTIADVVQYAATAVTSSLWSLSVTAVLGVTPFYKSSNFKYGCHVNNLISVLNQTRNMTE